METVNRSCSVFRKQMMTLSIPPAVQLLVAAFLMWMTLPVACATDSMPAPVHTSGVPEADHADYRSIKAALDRDGTAIDYDTLLEVYNALVLAPNPVAGEDRLLEQLINERNADPRIDQMVLIFAAKIIGNSRHSVPGAQKLFESILQKDDRINHWVLSYLAEAVGDYAFSLPQGNRLADAMEAKLSLMASEDRSGQEDFGRHFLPPPKSDYIRNYLNGIAGQADRQGERFRYYLLIRNHFTEGQIISDLRYLQAHGAPDSGERCPLLLQCLLRYLDRRPFAN